MQCRWEESRLRVVTAGKTTMVLSPAGRQPRAQTGKSFTTGLISLVDHCVRGILRLLLRSHAAAFLPWMAVSLLFSSLLHTRLP
jgi:hypothetical protein